ncbi:MAG: acyltransferase [Aeromicrobium sp.]|jgi:peptidoglycan/LPS O-acetylase OafA/YrhL|nr:acyltransferase [Aeromicrobium sp.]
MTEIRHEIRSLVDIRGPATAFVAAFHTRFNLVGGDSVLPIVWSYVLVLTTSIGLGAVTYRFVERPAMDWEPRTNREVFG